jgi:hypothetical protein
MSAVTAKKTKKGYVVPFFVWLEERERADMVAAKLRELGLITDIELPDRGEVTPGSGPSVAIDTVPLPDFPANWDLPEDWTGSQIGRPFTGTWRG